MKFQTKEEDHYIVVTLGDEKIDSSLSPELKGHIINVSTKNPEKHVIIDLSKVRFADSSGLSAFLLAYRLYRDHSRVCIFASPSPSLIELFEISQLINVFPIADNVDDAVAMLHQVK
jgi:anti-anti-sigma factor